MGIFKRQLFQKCFRHIQDSNSRHCLRNDESLLLNFNNFGDDMNLLWVGKKAHSPDLERKDMEVIVAQTLAWMSFRACVCCHG